MASNPAARWWRDPRVACADLWIAGCAAYYYARLTATFAAEYGDLLRVRDMFTTAFAV